jgi:DNA-binding IclR family transcriptional regulator
MKERVLAELANGPGTARQIAARMGLPRGSVASTLSKLAHHDDARAVAAFDEDAGASVYSLAG